jgi:5-methylcytosine-specific restriction endonuclease McrA
VAWPFEGRLETGLAAVFARYALGPGGRPNVTAWGRLREAVFRNVFGDHTAPHCLYCRAEDAPLVLDHAVPVSRGGSNHPLNLIPACVTCNAEKGSKTFAEYMATRRPKCS